MARTMAECPLHAGELSERQLLAVLVDEILSLISRVWVGPSMLLPPPMSRRALLSVCAAGVCRPSRDPSLDSGVLELSEVEQRAGSPAWAL